MMYRSHLSVVAVLFVALSIAFVSSEVVAGGRYRNYDCQQDGSSRHPHAGNLFMQNGLGWGKPFGDGPVASSIVRMESHCHPPDQNPCLTKTRHGIFTTIR